jgi:vancomycin permeability regulator SanA
MLAVLAGVAAMTINNHIVNREKDNILCTVTEEESLDSATREALQNFDADCIMVLGAGIRDDETPTPMLQDRLDAGILLYKAGVAPKILLTGDNGTLEHNEIHVMLNYVRNAGVPDEDIFCDHAGFSTYDSMYRARDIFGVSRMIVVTQTYHEYRALYIAEQLGLEVVGAGADQETYAGQPLREVREILARDKDFFKALLKPEAEIGGDAIPIDGNGISTHGE